jgi:hypothetical protein
MAPVGEGIQSAMRQLLDGTAIDLQRPTTLTNCWGVELTLATRVLQAVREPDPVSSLQLLPTPKALRSFVGIASQQGINGETLEAAEQAVEDYEELVKRLGGKKADLDTFVARRLDHSREKIEQAAKQSISRGYSSLIGVQAAASVLSCFIFPSEEPGWCDELVVHGYHGLRRLRPELPLLLGSREILDDEPSRMVTLERLRGGAICQNGMTTALLPFCTNPLPEIEIIADGNKLIYALPAESQDKIPAELDIFFSSMHRRADPMVGSPDNPRARYAFIPQNPSRHMIMDVFIHRDVWPGVEPELLLARIGNPGAPDLLAHALDQADYIETLQRLGNSASAIPHRHYRNQLPLVEYIHDQMKWELGDFRLYRCIVKYPVVGLWYTIQFPLSQA